MENYEYEEYELIDWSYWVDYYCEVVEKATELGYSEQQVAMLIDDIMHDYYNGLSINEVIDIKFSSKQENKYECL